MPSQDLRTLGVIPCKRCQDTGLARDDNGISWCDCPVGAVAYQYALDRAFGVAS